MATELMSIGNLELTELFKSRYELDGVDQKTFNRTETSLMIVKSFAMVQGSGHGWKEFPAGIFENVLLPRDRNARPRCPE